MFSLRQNKKIQYLTAREPTYLRIDVCVLLDNSENDWHTINAAVPCIPHIHCINIDRFEYFSVIAAMASPSFNRSRFSPIPIPTKFQMASPMLQRRASSIK